MSRIPEVPFNELSELQKRVYAEIAGPRGGVVRGPFAIWLRDPLLADKANQFGNALRVAGKLDKRLFELMVLMVARHWSAQYEWYVHERAAAEAGLSSRTIDAIRERRVPDRLPADEQIVHDVVDELHRGRTLSQTTYDRAHAALGTDLLVELVTAMGFYTLVAIVLNAFDAPVPGGAKPFEEPR